MDIVLLLICKLVTLISFSYGVDDINVILLNKRYILRHLHFKLYKTFKRPNQIELQFDNFQNVFQRGLLHSYHLIKSTSTVEKNKYRFTLFLL